MRTQKMLKKTFRSYKKDSSNYYYNLKDLNAYGYQLLNEKDNMKAISVFKFLTEEFPLEANLYDSLGEAYFESKDYSNALVNYKKAFELNPDNDNAIEYIKKNRKFN